MNVCEREREIERKCVCVCACVCTLVCVLASLFVRLFVCVCVCMREQVYVPHEIKPGSTGRVHILCSLLLDLLNSESALICSHSTLFLHAVSVSHTHTKASIIASVLPLRMSRELLVGPFLSSITVRLCVFPRNHLGRLQAFTHIVSFSPLLICSFSFRSLFS